MSSPSDLLEERWNVITHGLGIALALLGIPFLVYTALTKGDPAHVWAVSIFAASVLLMYAVPTTLHRRRHPEDKRWFQFLDHISIYYLIAGSYTPCLVFCVDEPARSSYLLLMWGIAVAGTVFKLFFTGRFTIISTALYLAMGWMVIFIGQPIIQGLNAEGLTWLIIGGGGYSLGVIFFLWNKLPYNHAIWHVFVLAGTASHFLAVWAALGG